MYTIRDVSEMTGIKVRTLRSWIAKKEVASFKDEKTGRVYILDSEIEKLEGKAMAVRNFYLKANIDGRKTMLKGGPRKKDGWMEVEILQRDKGGKTVAFKISCGEYDGKLYTEIVDSNDEIVAVYETER